MKYLDVTVQGTTAEQWLERTKHIASNEVFMLATIDWLAMPINFGQPAKENTPMTKPDPKPYMRVGVCCGELCRKKKHPLPDVVLYRVPGQDRYRCKQCYFHERGCLP